MIWFMLWLLLSAFVLGAFFWSIRILMGQKRAWKNFATKLGLQYGAGGRLLASPEITGTIDGLRLNMFTERRAANDARGERFVTAIELVMSSAMPMSGAICTASMAEMVGALRLDDVTVPEGIAEWDAGWRVRSDNVDLMQRFLTPLRCDILKKIFRMKVLAALYIFDRRECVLRIETSDPLNNTDKMEKIIRGFIPMVKSMALTAEERANMPAAPEDVQQPVPAATQPVPQEEPRYYAPQGLDENATDPSTEN